MGAFKAGKNLAVDKDGTLHVTGIEQIEEKIAQTVDDIAKSKAILAGAITERGVDTAADDSFAVMAKNVMKISSGVTYDVLTNDGKLAEYTLIEG